MDASPQRWISAFDGKEQSVNSFVQLETQTFKNPFHDSFHDLEKIGARRGQMSPLQKLEIPSRIKVCPDESRRGKDGSRCLDLLAKKWV